MLLRLQFKESYPAVGILVRTVINNSYSLLFVLKLVQLLLLYDIYNL